jgi:hypothetical protein
LEVKAHAGSTAAATATTTAGRGAAASAKGPQVAVVAVLEKADLDALPVEVRVIEILNRLRRLLLALVCNHCVATPELHLDLAIVVELLLENALVGLEVQIAHEHLSTTAALACKSRAMFVFVQSPSA